MMSDDRCSYVWGLCAHWHHSGSKAQQTTLTHWGRVTHICVSKLTTISSDNGLSPGRRQAIIWTNAGILLIGRLGTNFSEILIVIHTFSFKKMHLKMSSVKWRAFRLGLNVLSLMNLQTEYHIGVHNTWWILCWYYPTAANITGGRNTQPGFNGYIRVEKASPVQWWPLCELQIKWWYMMSNY